MLYVTSTEGTRRRRVPAMAPDERRAALIAATVPLLREHGMDVTTKQIAQAAGVAEGTIFGVFKDKNSLLEAALLEVVDPSRTVNMLIGIDPDADLRTRLAEAADRLSRGFQSNAPIFAAIRTLAFTHDDPEFRQRMLSGRERTVRALTELIEPDKDQLRRDPSEVAGFLLMLIGATNHGAFGGIDRFDAGELVSLLLDGVLVRNHDHDHDHIHGGTARC
jgi:AcrR family transcriptional regulator